MTAAWASTASTASLDRVKFWANVRRSSVPPSFRGDPFIKSVNDARAAHWRWVGDEPDPDAARTAWRFCRNRTPRRLERTCSAEGCINPGHHRAGRST